MDLSTIKTFAQYGGVAGLALVTLIMIFREIIEKALNDRLRLPPNKIFHLLVTMVVCASMVTVAGIGAWAWVSTRQKATVENLQKPTVEVLKPLKPIDRQLVEAVAADQPAKVDALLKQGANPNATDADGQTSLHYAAAAQSSVLVDRLIKSGARAGVQNKLGVTPYGVANFKGDAGIQSKLMAARPPE